MQASAGGLLGGDQVAGLVLVIPGVLSSAAAGRLSALNVTVPSLIPDATDGQVVNDLAPSGARDSARIE